ncbi:MAG: molybdopterin molybdotransferase MoeA [Acidimicrobiales bacterium]
MIDVATARRKARAICPPPVQATVATIDALGCVLAEAARAEVAVPPFANSAMDGYALRATDAAPAPVTLEVVGRVLAGSNADVRVGPGQAVRIMTGAPIPPGADAVCMVERTRPAGTARVVIEAPAEPGDHIRPAGDDVGIGDVVLDAGGEIGPTQLAALISAGCRHLTVYRPPRVGVISTGDELVDPGASLGPAQIYDSNRPMLAALVAEAGCTPIDLGRAPDDETALTDRIGDALPRIDALVLSGGVSVGDVDLVRVVLDRLADGRGEWMQIAIRPGKPFSCAPLPGPRGTVPAFGLPGNPVSSAVSFELFVRPSLRTMAGRTTTERPRIRAHAGEAFHRRVDGKLHLVRVRIERQRAEPAVPSALAGPTGDAAPVLGEWTAWPCAGQGSHQIHSTATADGLALVPDGEGVSAGQWVEVVVTGPAALARPAR